METYTKSKYGEQATDWEGIKWVLKARGKEESRYGFKYVNSNGKRIAATDGHRLHIFKPSQKLPLGTYEVIESKEKIIFNLIPDYNFTNWVGVIPKHRRDIRLQVRSNPKEDHVQAVAAIFRALPADRLLNLQYLSDCLNGDEYWKVNEDKDGNGPMMFRNGNKTAVIMPIKA